MAAVELATAYVTLAVDSSQIGKQIGKGFAGGDKIAMRSGRAMGDSMRKAFSASKPLDVGSATKKLEDAQDRLAVHTERSASKQQKAQENVAAAREKVAEVATKSSEKVTSAQSKVESAEEHLARVTEQSSRDQESAKRKVELAQAQYNDTVSKYGAESTQALGAANRLADAEDRLAKTTSDGAAKQEAAKRKVADAQEQYSKAVKESGEDSEAARKAADELSVAEQKLEAASLEAASGHEKLAAEVSEAKSALDQAERSTKGLRGAWGKAKDFGADYKGMGDRLNKAIGPKIWTGIKWGALGAAGAVAGALGGALVKGWGRLTAIENAEAKLTGLGHSAESVEAIMDNALASVKGTAFGLDEAAGLAGTLVASGIEPGKELEKTLALTADSATIAGRELGDMGLIWGSVAAKGKLQGDDAQQLLASGVPIWQMVGDVMGKTAAEAQELGSKGKVSFDIFRDAMEKGVGGAAQEAGNTTQGAFKNMGAAMGRFGAALLKDVYPMIGPVFGKVTDLFDYLTDAAGPAMEKVVDGLKPFAAGLKGVFDILAGGDFTGAENLFGFEEDSGFVEFLFGVRDVASGLYENVLKPIGSWLAENWKPIASALAGLAAFFGGSMLVSAIANLISPFTTLVSVLGGVLPAIGAVIAAVNWWLVAAAALSAFLGYFFTQTDTGKAIVTKAWEAIQKTVAVVADFFTGTVWPALLTGWEILKAVVTAVWDGAIKPIFKAIGNLAVQIWQGVVIPAFNQLVGYLRDTVMPIVQQLWTDYIKPVFMAIGGLAVWLWHNAIKPAVSLITAYWTNVLGPVIVWLWQKVILPAFSAIGNIIAGVVTGVIFPILDGLKWLITNAIGPAVMWLWRNVFQPAWEGIKDAVAVTAQWIVNTAIPWLKDAWTAISEGAIDLYQNGILPAWNGIKDAIKATGDWVTGTLVPALKTAWDGIAAAATWLWQNIIKPVWDGIRIAIAIAVTAVLVYIDLMKWYFTNVIAPAATWLWQKVMKPVWDGIKSAIGAVVDWFTGTAWPILKAAWDAVAAAATWLYRSVMLPVWNAIKAAINAVVTWFRDTAWPLVKSVIDFLALGFRNLYTFVILPVWNAIKSAINAVAVWFRDTAWPLVKSVIEKIKTGFNVMRDALKAAWKFVRDNVINPVVTWLRDTAWGKIIAPALESIKRGFNGMRDSLKKAWAFIKDNVIAPVVNWLMDTVKTKFDTFTDNVKTAFDTLKDNVLAAWDGIKAGMKKPINGVIEIYNEHIAGNFNKVAKTLGLDEKYQLDAMSKFHTGGYTGPGSKYQEAGIVHADEFVIRKESQNDLARRAPGFLDSLNRHGSRALGYAGGGLVKLRAPFAGSYPQGEGFGARGGRHKGIDWPMPSGAVLKAVAAGHVKHTRNPAAGNKLELTLGNGLVAGYHHLSSFIAGNGSSVGRGADVARVGSTGRSSGPHLHFSLKRDGSYVNPAPYLSGGGEAGDGSGGSWWNPFDGLWSSIKNTLAAKVGDTPVGGIVSGVAKQTIEGVGAWVKDKLVGSWDALAEVGSTVGSAAKAARWMPIAQHALSMTGDGTEANLSSLMRRMGQESNYNPRAINDWDSNAKRGTPSKGLMQVIQPTFDAYKYPGHNDIWDPLSNILASIRYTKSAYGSLTRGWDRKGGYADGGLVKPYLHDSGGWHDPGQLSLNLTRQPEAVLTAEQWSTMHSLAGQALASGGGDRIHIEHAGLSPQDVVTEMDKRKRERAALRVPVRA